MATFSESEEERIHADLQSSRILEASSYVSPYHPRYNTPVSENNEDVAARHSDAGLDDGRADDDDDDDGEDRHDHCDTTTTPPQNSDDRRPDGDGGCGGFVQSAGTVTTTTVDGATQICSALATDKYGDGMRFGRQQVVAGNVLSEVAVSLDAAQRLGLPLLSKGRTPSFEILPGGRLVSSFLFFLLHRQPGSRV